MLLEEAIQHLAKAKIDGVNAWYDWRAINESRLPLGIRLPAGNKYRKNEALKLLLSTEYSIGNNARKLALTEYYIKIWGGVRGNGSDKLKAYALEPPGALIGRGARGIASWSKALAIRDPLRYAIYDARVATSLNCLQVIHGTSTPTFFQITDGRNAHIKRGVQFLRAGPARRWKEEGDAHFYKSYIRAISQVSKALGTKIYTVEMLLFSEATALLCEVGCA